MTDSSNVSRESSTQIVGRASLSGRSVVISLVATTILLLIIGIPTVLRFAEAQNALDDARQTWPDAALELTEDYQRVLSSIDQDAQPAIERFAKSQEEFRSHVLFDDQLPAAIAVEKAIDELPKSPLNRNFERPGIRKYLASEARLRQSREGFIGWITYTFLRLPEPPQIGPFLE